MSGTSNDHFKSRTDDDKDPIVDLVAMAASAADNPAWQDERFLDWLARQTNRTESTVRAAALELSARVYCRRYSVTRRFGAAPVLSRRDNESLERTIPLHLASAYRKGIATESDQLFVVPSEMIDSDCVAIYADEQIDAFVPLVHEGDTLLVTRSGSDKKPVVHAVDRRDRLTLCDSAEPGVIGVLSSVWCPHQPRDRSTSDY